jgi:hypothetical protein
VTDGTSNPTVGTPDATDGITDTTEGTSNPTDGTPVTTIGIPNNFINFTNLKLRVFCAFLEVFVAKNPFERSEKELVFIYTHSKNPCNQCNLWQKTFKRSEKAFVFILQSIFQFTPSQKI